MQNFLGAGWQVATQTHTHNVSRRQYYGMDVLRTLKGKNFFILHCEFSICVYCIKTRAAFIIVNKKQRLLANLVKDSLRSVFVMVHSRRFAICLNLLKAGLLFSTKTRWNS